MKEKKNKESKINEYNTDFLKSSEKHNFCINHTMNNKEYEKQIKEFYKDEKHTLFELQVSNDCSVENEAFSLFEKFLIEE